MRRRVQRRRHEDLRLFDDSRGQQDRRVRARAWTPALRLAGPVRYGRIERRAGQLVPDGWQQLERQRRHPFASIRVVQGEPGLGHGYQPDDQRCRHHQGRSRAAARCTASGRTAQAAGNISCWRTGSARCMTESCPEEGLFVYTSTKPSTGTMTKTTPSSSCWRPTASTIYMTARTAATRATRIPAVRKTWPSRARRNPTQNRTDTGTRA